MSDSINGIVSAVQTPGGLYVIKAGDAEYLPLSGGFMTGAISAFSNTTLIDWGYDGSLQAGTPGVEIRTAGEDGYYILPAQDGGHQPSEYDVMRRKDLSGEMSGYLPLSGGEMSGDISCGDAVGIDFNGVQVANGEQGDGFAVYVDGTAKYAFYDTDDSDYPTPTPPQGDADVNVMRGMDVYAALSGLAKVYIDGQPGDLSVIHMSKEDYDEAAAQGSIISNALYIVSGDYVEYIRNGDGLGISSDLCCTVSGDGGLRTTKLATLDDLSGYLKLRPTANQSVDVSDYDVVFGNGSQYIKIDHTAAYLEAGGEDGGITIESGAYNEFKDGAKLVVYPAAQIQFVDGSSYGVRSVISSSANATTVVAGSESYGFRSQGQNISTDVVRFKDLSGLGGQIYIDDRVSGVHGYNDISVTKLWEDDYAQMVRDGTVVSNMIYVTQQSCIDAYGGKVVNVAEPEVSSDAATKHYVDTHGGGGGTLLGNYTGSQRISGDITIASMTGSNVQVYTKFVNSQPKLSVGVFYV